MDTTVQPSERPALRSTCRGSLAVARPLIEGRVVMCSECGLFVRGLAAKPCTLLVLAAQHVPLTSTHHLGA